VPEPTRRKLSVTDGRLNAAVAQEALQRPGIGATVSKGIAGCVPEHMRVSFERQLGPDPCPLDQLGEARHGERRSALRNEDERRPGVTLEVPQYSQFVAEQRMCCSSSALGAAQMQRPGLKLGIGPLQATKLTNAQAVTECQQDHCGIA